MDAELFQDVVRVRQHVHQVRDRRALIAGDIRHAGFEQRLGDGEDAFAAELLSRAQLQLLDFFLERSFGHACSAVIPEAAQRLSEIHSHDLRLWIPGSRLWRARNDRGVYGPRHDGSVNFQIAPGLVEKAPGWLT